MHPTVAYVVTPANPEELEAARAGGAEVLYQGDAAGVARFFEDLTLGFPYAVLTTAPPERRERVRAALLRCEGLAAQMEASLLSVRSLFPMDPDNEAMLLGIRGYDFDMEVTTTLEHCLHDSLPSLRKQLQRVAWPEGGREGEV